MTGAAPLRIRDIAAEISHADLVAAARVRAIRPKAGPVAPVSDEADEERDVLYVAEAEILRVLAGPRRSSVEVDFLRGRQPGRPWPRIAVDDTVLLFLHGNVLVDPAASPVRTRPDLPPPPSGLSAVAAVQRELEQVVLAEPVAPLDLLLDAVTARIALPDDAKARRIDDPVRQVAWTVIALGDGDPDALAELPRLFGTPAPAVQAFLPLLAPLVAEVSDRAAIPLLTPIVRLAEPVLTHAAAEALRGMAGPDVVHDLVTLLDHHDREVRYQAVMGLAESHPDVDDGGPALDRYLADEQRWLRTWRAWAAQHGLA